MKKFWPVPHRYSVLILIWICILAAAALVSAVRPITPSFPYYKTDLSQYPQSLAVFAHFDGIHYLRIARYGYQDTGTQAFFPLYPLLVRALTQVTQNQLLAAVMISLGSLLLALRGLGRLFGRSGFAIALILLVYPVSFFFGAVYTESLFLALTVWFFISLKGKQWYTAAVLAALASAARPIGIFLTVGLLLTIYRDKKYGHLLPAAAIGSSGLVMYMAYLASAFGDPLMFFHVQPLFGAERTGSEIVLLPQVLYRYMKMIVTVEASAFLYQRIWLELAAFGCALYLALRNMRRVPAAQSLFVLMSLILPTLTGTLSSMPRYVAVLVPWLLPPDLKITPRLLIWICISTFGLLYLFTQFTHGIFVA